MNRIWTCLWLTIVWVLLWGTPSAANILGGIVVAGLVTTIVPVSRQAGARVDVMATIRLALWFVPALVAATAKVAWQVVTPRPRLHQQTVTVGLQSESPLVCTVVANLISLTPGTLTVEVRPDGQPEDSANRALLVHHLQAGDEASVRAECARIERLVVAAFGTEDDRRCLVTGARTHRDGSAT